MATLREQALQRLGGQCVECGDADLSHLQIDHVHGRGNAHRRALKAQGLPFYQWVLTADAPDVAPMA